MIELLFWVIMGLLTVAILAAAAMLGLWLWVLWPHRHEVWEDLKDYLNRERGG